jgi:hypothetical protein
MLRDLWAFAIAVTVASVLIYIWPRSERQWTVKAVRDTSLVCEGDQCFRRDLLRYYPTRPLFVVPR